MDNQPPVDLNLLRLLEAIYRLGSVSRAADALGLSQPAASQGLSRLRRSLGDALFVRAGQGVQATLRTEQLMSTLQPALATINQALKPNEQFEPRQSRMLLRMHLSDIGEARLLPELMTALHREAPGIRVETAPLPHAEIADALATGKIHFALGFLPSLTGVERVALFQDHYAVLVRSDHPLLSQGKTNLSVADLKKLEFVAVRSHAETLRILYQLGLESRLALTSAHFLALPAIIVNTDFAVVMPHAIAQRLMSGKTYSLLPTELPNSEFTVSLYWNRRFDADPAHRWIRQLFTSIFHPQLAQEPA